jgi:aspartate/methionine/tyrosine aminotransferase
MRAEEVKGLWLGLIGVAIFALTLPMTRLAVGTSDAPQMSGVFIAMGRAVVATALSAVFLLATRAPMPRRGDWLPLAITSAGVVFGFPLFTSIAMRYVEAVHASVIAGVLPLATAAVGAWLHRQRPSPGFWVCAAVGGVLVVAFAILRSGRSGLSIQAADALLLAGMACGAVGYGWGGRLSQRMPAEHVICWALVLALPLTAPAALLTLPQSALPAVAWWGFAYVAVFSMWLGFSAGSRILVETPTYLGALQAFSPMEPEVVSVASDDQGVDPADLADKAQAARFLYVLPNFQNPTGRTMTESRRVAVSCRAAELGLPLIEDNPYGDLWFEAPPPLPLTARHPEGCVYLGSFSKVLAPGLRLGFLVAPKTLYPKLLQAKQAADLHSPSFNQCMVAEVMKDGFLDRHVPTIRALYKSQRDAMLAALQREMQGLEVTWNTPDGGMFLWARLPPVVSAVELLPKAVDKGVAFVPGAAFYAGMADPRALRLSFVTASREQIDAGIAALAQAIREQVGNR